VAGRKLTTVHSKSARRNSFDLPCTIDACRRVLAKQLQRERNIALANAWPRSGRER